MSEAEHATGISRRALVAGALLATLPFTAEAFLSPGAQEFPPALGTLRERAEKKGLLVGTSFDLKQFNDPRMIAAIRRDSNILVPENGFNWTRTQSAKDMPLNFKQVEPVYELTTATHSKMRLHNLVYDLTTPKWVNELVPELSNDKAEKLLARYIQSVLSAWGSRVCHIEVVNEPVFDLNRRHRPFVFSEKLGQAYFDIAYHTAREAAPNTLLFTNVALMEPNTSASANMRREFLAFLDDRIKENTPIDAIGIEAHLLTEAPFSPEIFSSFLQEIVSRGLVFMVTELDVNDRGIFGDIATRDAGSASLAKSFLDVALSYPQCLGLLTWNGCDRYTWLRSQAMTGDAPGKRQRFDGQMLRPTPLDDNYQPKPLWRAIAAAIDGAPVRPMA